MSTADVILCILFVDCVSLVFFFVFLRLTTTRGYVIVRALCYANRLIGDMSGMSIWRFCIYLKQSFYGFQHKLNRNEFSPLLLRSFSLYQSQYFTDFSAFNVSNCTFLYHCSAIKDRGICRGSGSTKVSLGSPVSTRDSHMNGF